jgi:hypothetical protein
MNWTDILKGLAPTLASAALGPLGGVAVSAIGSALGMDNATKDKVAKAFTDGQLTPEAIERLRTLEMQYQNDEKERGFKYAELQYKDVDSARNMAVQTHSLTPSLLTWLIVAITLTAEGLLLFHAMPANADPIIIGRVLGTMDSALIMVLGFWFGSNSNSQRKTELLAQANSVPPQ